MRYKLALLAGLGTGYVLGAKAGRDRYEQLAKAARGIAQNPAVRQGADAVQVQAGQFASSAGRFAAGTGKKAGTTVSHKIHDAAEQRRDRKAEKQAMRDAKAAFANGDDADATEKDAEEGETRHRRLGRLAEHRPHLPDGLHLSRSRHPSSIDWTGHPNGNGELH